MNLFIRNICRFMAVFIIIMMTLVGLSVLFVNNVTFEIEKHKNILVIGDSHTECAIDDAVFTRSVNYSNSAAPYVYSYAKLRKLLADNPHIDTLLLSFQFSSLNYDLERRWIYNETRLIDKMSTFFPFMQPDDVRHFAFEASFYKAVALTPKVAFDYGISRMKGSTHDWYNKHLGHYLPLRYSRLERDVKSRVPYDKLGQPDTVSLVQIDYLRKIIDYCKSHGVVLVLINTPVYQSEKFTSYISFEKNRKKYVSDQLFLDYARFPLPDSMFADVAHLNTKGAAMFSRYLETHLTEDLKRQNERLTVPSDQ